MYQGLLHFSPDQENSDGSQSDILSQSILRLSGRHLSSATTIDDTNDGGDDNDVIIPSNDLNSVAAKDESVVKQNSSQEVDNNSNGHCQTDLFEGSLDPSGIQLDFEASQRQQVADKKKDAASVEDFDKIDPLWFEDELSTQTNKAAKAVVPQNDVVIKDLAEAVPVPRSSKPLVEDVPCSSPGGVTKKTSTALANGNDKLTSVKDSTPDSLAFVDFDTMDLLAEHNSKTSDLNLSLNLKNNSEKVLRVYFTNGVVIAN